MDCFLDGVKYAGRVEMSFFSGVKKRLFGQADTSESNTSQAEANQPGGEIPMYQRKQLKNFYDMLIMPFFGKGKGNDDKITYEYRLYATKLNNATLSQIVQGITEFQYRNINTNVLNEKNPSIKIDRTKVDVYIYNDEQVNKFVDLLGRLKIFIAEDIKDKTFNGLSVKETPLHVLIDIPKPSRAAVTPKRSRYAQAQDPSQVSTGGRRNKRHHTKRAKRSKRSKHTRRRKH
jgi:hypothetical protein